jgi:hypothetical protein
MNKHEANQRRARLFARSIEQYSGLSRSEIERVLQIGTHDELPAELRKKDGTEKTGNKAGETLYRWGKGRGKRVEMRAVQELAQAALAKGMLPPLKEGLLRRHDVFGVIDMTINEDQAWVEASKRLHDVRALQAAAVEAVRAFAAAVQEHSDLLVVDTSVNEELDGISAEASASYVQDLAQKLRSLACIDLAL